MSDFTIGCIIIECVISYSFRIEKKMKPKYNLVLLFYNILIFILINYRDYYIDIRNEILDL